MLPNVGGSGNLYDRGNHNGNNGKIFDSDFGKLKLTSFANQMGNKSRRALSSKSAHFATIPFDPGAFPSPNVDKRLVSQRKPYLPFSATAVSRQKLGSQQQLTGGNSRDWKASSPNGVKPEFSHRARAHSHKSAKGIINTGMQSKSVPTLPNPNPKKQGAITASSSSDVVTASRLSPSGEDGDMVMTGIKKAPVVGGSIPLTASKVQCNRERFQVCRTKEEKEKSPDCIRLDKCGLRAFPDIGGGESLTVKLLSLQHNLITRLENVPLLTQLVVLDLYDNRIERITGLQGLPSLRVLLLGKNRIRRIEGMDNLKRLEILDLHGNQLRYVDNLGPLSSLRVLNLAGNLLRNIRTIGPYGMSSLTELNLKRNRIKNLDGLQKAPHLKKLLIANNDLQNIATLAPLRKMLFLQELLVDPNPLVSSTTNNEYRNQMLTLFPNLTSLDRVSVTEEMKQEARQWHKAKLAEEEAKKQQEARLRQELTVAVGPPGSREQVIYQARRRWESLRNFVKNSNSESKPKQVKSVRNAVSAVMKPLSERRKPNSDVLYPPATLDLEQFPDGQAEFDKTECLLDEGHQVQCRNKVENECKSCNGEQSVSTNHNAQSSLKLNKELEHSHSAPGAKVAKDLVIVDNQKPENAPKATMESVKADMEPNPSGNHEFEVEVGRPGGSAELGNGEGEVVTLNDANEVNISSARSSKSTCSEARQSAKIAVVRPLIRNENGVVEVIRTTSPSPTSPENNVTNSVDDGGGTIAVKERLVVANNTEVTKNVVEKDNADETEVNLISEGFSGAEGAISTTSKDESRTSTELRSGQNKVLCPVNQDGLKISEGVGEIKNSCRPKLLEKSPEPSALAPSQGISSETTGKSNKESSEVRARPKMLRHLRSISLDSGVQPLTQPTPRPQLPDQVNIFPDDLVDDEDDNDNEVQDFACDYDYDGGADDDACSIGTSTTTGTSASTTPRRSSTVIATTNRLLKSGASFRKQTFPRTKSQRIRMRDKAAKLFGSTSDLSPRSTSTPGIKRVSSSVGVRNGDGNLSGRPSANGKVLRRSDSAISLTSPGTAVISSTAGPTTAPGGNISNGAVKSVGNNGNDEQVMSHRKQGVDFLVEIEGKHLNVFGQGGLRHALTAFTSNVTCHVNVAKFHYITFDSIIPFFGKLRQVYPSLEHFHFRANNLCTLAQLDALSDLQGLSSLFIAKEGNPIVALEAWVHYASYRLSHWGLQVINGKEISSEYRGGVTCAAQSKGFESLGFLALSCLPQTALTPLAKRLHMLHCFCCCSPSTSSDESNNKPQRLVVNHSSHNRVRSPSQQIDHGSSGNFCTAWDDDPVLLDVIGKEALVYCPPTLHIDGDITSEQANSTSSGHQDQDRERATISQKNGAIREQLERKRSETLKNLIHSGVEIVEKVDRLERVWPTLMAEVIQEILMDFRFMDSYMKKEYKKVQDAALINNNQQSQHFKKLRH